MPTYTLADLRTAQTQDVIAARLVAALAARGLPTASWTPAASGGVEMTTVNMVAGTLAKLVGPKMASAVSGRFLDLATGDLLTFLAKHFYLLDRNPATFTIQNVRLFSTPTAPANSFAPGDVWVRSSATGNRYVNLDQIDLPPGKTNGISARFQAELPGASYNDPEGTIDTMVVAPAGVTCLNSRPSDYLPARTTGVSTGTIQAQADDATQPPPVAMIKVRIDISGNLGAGQFSYSFDGGSSWVQVIPLQALVATAGGVHLILQNGGASPSFVAGDVFTLLRANAILQQGADQETEASLRARCRFRWPGLSLVPTGSLVMLWAQLASPEVHKVRVDANPDTPGWIDVTIASSAGPASGQAQLDVADYITPRLAGFKGVPASAVGGSPEEGVNVKSAAARAITPAGLVTVPRAKLDSAQRAADVAWLAYLAGLDLGGTVVLAELEQAVMDAGAVTFSGMQLNGSAANVQLAANEIAVAAAGTSLTKSLSWRPV